MQLVSSEVFCFATVGRAAEKPGEVGYQADVVVPGLGAKLPDGHVFDYRWRSGVVGAEVMGISCLQGCPLISDRTRRTRCLQTDHHCVCQPPCRGSGLVLWRVPAATSAARPSET